MRFSGISGAIFWGFGLGSGVGLRLGFRDGVFFILIIVRQHNKMIRI